MENSKHTEWLIRAGFGVALGLLAVIGLVGYVSVVRLSENSANVNHSQEVMRHIDQMVAATTEAEAARLHHQRRRTIRARVRRGRRPRR
jgi:CHASE3 domain sensor protein